MTKTVYRYETGKKLKTDFTVQKKTTVISSLCIDTSSPLVVLNNITIKDLENLVRGAKKRAKICKKLGSFFVHLSPDVSLLMKGGKK